MEFKQFQTEFNRQISGEYVYDVENNSLETKSSLPRAEHRTTW